MGYYITIYPDTTSKLQEIKVVITEAFAEFAAMMSKPLTDNNSASISLWGDAWEVKSRGVKVKQTLGLSVEDLDKLTEHLLTFPPTSPLPDFDCFPMRRSTEVCNPLSAMMRAPGLAPGPAPVAPVMVPGPAMVLGPAPGPQQTDDDDDTDDDGEVPPLCIRGKR